MGEGGWISGVSPLQSSVQAVQFSGDLAGQLGDGRLFDLLRLEPAESIPWWPSGKLSRVNLHLDRPVRYIVAKLVVRLPQTGHSFQRRTEFSFQSFHCVPAGVAEGRRKVPEVVQQPVIKTSRQKNSLILVEYGRCQVPFFRPAPRSRFRIVFGVVQLEGETPRPQGARGALG